MLDVKRVLKFSLDWTKDVRQVDHRSINYDSVKTGLTMTKELISISIVSLLYQIANTSFPVRPFEFRQWIRQHCLDTHWHKAVGSWLESLVKKKKKSSRLLTFVCVRKHF